MTLTLDNSLKIDGIPKNLSDTDIALLRSRIYRFIEGLPEDSKQNLHITITNNSNGAENSPTTVQANQQNTSSNGNDSSEKRVEQYLPIVPYFTMEQFVGDEELREELNSAIDLILLQGKVFDDWGLRQIEPFPRTALNFHGLPGTGKTLVAHGIAHVLGKLIIVASYAQIESKFLGDAPKNVEALFKAAEEYNAVLFIDEADSLLSKRMGNVSQGSERAANSLTSQLLICLEKFRGVVIFATNLVENYDTAFETRVRHIHFPLPNEKAREQIWAKLLVPELPLADDVLVEELAKVDDVCGRDIKNAIIDATVRTARQGKEKVELAYFIEAIEKIKKSRPSNNNKTNQSTKLTPEEQAKVREKIMASSQLHKEQNDQ